MPIYPFWMGLPNVRPFYQEFTIQALTRTRGAGGLIHETIEEHTGTGLLIPMSRALEGAQRGNIIHATHELHVHGDDLPVDVSMTDTMIVIAGERYRPLSRLNFDHATGVTVFRLVKEVIANAD